MFERHLTFSFFLASIRRGAKLSNGTKLVRLEAAFIKKKHKKKTTLKRFWSLLNKFQRSYPPPLKDGRTRRLVTAKCKVWVEIYEWSCQEQRSSGSSCGSWRANSIWGAPVRDIFTTRSSDESGSCEKCESLRQFGVISLEQHFTRFEGLPLSSIIKWQLAADIKNVFFFFLLFFK